MKFLCLICAERVMEQMPEADAEQALRGLPRVHCSDQEERPLPRVQPAATPEAATTVRVRQGKVSTTDGPYVETKEQLGGYYVIEATDLDEAVQVAARIPGAWIGCVEVRPIAEDEQTLRALGFLAPDAPR